MGGAIGRAGVGSGVSPDVGTTCRAKGGPKCGFRGGSRGGSSARPRCRARDGARVQEVPWQVQGWNQGMSPSYPWMGRDSRPAQVYIRLRLPQSNPGSLEP